MSVCLSIHYLLHLSCSCLYLSVVCLRLLFGGEGYFVYVNLVVKGMNNNCLPSAFVMFYLLVQISVSSKRVLSPLPSTIHYGSIQTNSSLHSQTGNTPIQNLLHHINTKEESHTASREIRYTISPDAHSGNGHHIWNGLSRLRQSIPLRLRRFPCLLDRRSHSHPQWQQLR